MTGARKLNLLLIDDDPAIVRLAKAYLDGALLDRLNIYAMTDPGQARKWIDDHCCDILVSDIEMPGTDGLEMLEFAKQSNSWTQVIFITAHSTWDRISAAIEKGATDYLIKPIQRDELIDLVSQQCDRLGRWQVALHDTLSPTSPA